MSLLRVDCLTRTFGGLVAVNRVSLRVGPAERRAIIGPNGAGKTTLFNLLSGELKPMSGAIVFDDVDVTHMPAYARARLGMGRTFQRNSLFPALTVVEHLQVAAQHKRVDVRHLLTPAGRQSDLQAEVGSLVHEYRLAEQAHVEAQHLSYGDQRRLEIAMAMATGPRLLLLDEPTAGMSLDDSARFLEWINALPRSVTVMIIEHDMDVVFGLADRITVLHYGEVIADGPPEDVRNDPRVMEVYLGHA